MPNGIYPGNKDRLNVLAQSRIGTHLSDETKLKISKSLTGRHLSEESRKKISETHKGPKNPNYGSPLSEEHRKNISLALTGKHHTEETRRKMSESRKGPKNHNYGKPLSEETKKKISLSKKGTPCCEETRKKLSASVQQAWENKKRQQLYRERYYQKNRKKIIECTAKHHRDNPEYYKEYYRKRKLDRINATFEEFGYSVDSLDRMGRAIGY